jgi:hypothetical protein
MTRRTRSTVGPAFRLKEISSASERKQKNCVPPSLRIHKQALLFFDNMLPKCRRQEKSTNRYWQRPA